MSPLWGSPQGLVGGRKVVSAQGLYGYSGTLSVTGATTSTTWPLTNLAIFVPVLLEVPTLLAQAFVANGAAVSGNFDVGLYSADGVRLVSTGSTAQSGTTTIQAVNISDVLIAAGLYYVALAFDNTTAAVAAATIVAARGQIAGLAEMTSAFALPAVATLASYTRALVPSFGFVGDAVI